MGHYILTLVSFTLAAGVFTATPGLDTVMTLRTAASGGKLAGAGAVTGICLGLTIWGIAAAFGLAALFQASHLAFMIVKCAGAAYLGWLGFCLLANPRTSLSDNGKQAGAGERASSRSVFLLACRRGLMTNLLNPKVGIFMITFFPQFIPPHVNTVMFSLMLTIIQTVLDVLWLGALVLLTVPLGRFLRRPEVVRQLDRLTGLIFIGFGVKILLEKSTG